MKKMKWICSLAVALATVGIVCPQAVRAAQVANASHNPALQIKDGGQLLLGPAGLLQGALVDANGKGVDKAPVVVVRKRQVVAQLITDAEGRFQVDQLTAGEYLVATHDGIYRYDAVTQAKPDQALKQGAIIKVDGEIARGKWLSGMALGTGLLCTLAIAGIVAGIIIATDDDDDNS